VSFYLVQGPDYYQLHSLPAAAAALAHMWAVSGVDYTDITEELRCSSNQQLSDKIMTSY